MSRLQYSKAALHKLSSRLKRYRQYLPSLDLKRQQLIAERTKAVKQLRDTEREIELGMKFIADSLPMVADFSINLEELIAVDNVRIVPENLIGVEVPRLDGVEMTEQPYSFFCKPHWVDMAVQKMKELLELRLRFEVEKQRLKLLEQAVKKVTQRVNLFDKILIPRTEQDIRKIRIFLSDTERAAVVRAKITKQKRLKEAS